MALGVGAPVFSTTVTWELPELFWVRPCLKAGSDVGQITVITLNCNPTPNFELLRTRLYERSILYPETYASNLKALDSKP